MALPEWIKALLNPDETFVIGSWNIQVGGKSKALDDYAIGQIARTID